MGCGGKVWKESRRIEPKKQVLPAGWNSSQRFEIAAKKSVGGCRVYVRRETKRQSLVGTFEKEGGGFRPGFMAVGVPDERAFGSEIGSDKEGPGEVSRLIKWAAIKEIGLHRSALLSLRFPSYVHP